MNEKITITIKVSARQKRSAEFVYTINLYHNEPIIEYMNIPAMLFRHKVPDFESMLAMTLQEYLGKNREQL